ncbi:riboflavin synthase [Celeribacter marinus]|uniref:riboflavin synthase n=1 Tax=Celeribacter marinus TaxID=1397108 RepID=UPI003F6C6091
MFTGIITNVGHVLELEQKGDLRARIGCDYDVDGIDIGASIACSGVCLTVIALGTAPQNWFDVQISAESVSKTNIRDWAVGSALNLERALRLGDELGGHIVSGHVDGVATIVSMTDEGESTRFVFDAPEALAKFVAPKGSVALDGTSFTVNEVDGCRFGVNIIPHTQQVTTWGSASVGDVINLEIDTLARYVARLAEFD